MNTIETLARFIVGSRAYGTHLDKSDKDELIVFKYTDYNSLCFDKPLTFRDGDTLYVEISEFVKGLLRSDITYHEVLWSTTKNCLSVSSAFKTFMNRRRDFITHQTVQDWFNHSQYLFSKACRLGQLELKEKNIVDFCYLIERNVDHPSPLNTLRQAIERGSFNKYTYAPGLNVQSLGVFPLNKGVPIYPVFEQWKIEDNQIQLKGLFDENKDILIDYENEMPRTFLQGITFKGLIYIDKRGFKKYKLLQERLSKIERAQGYSLKSMYHAFRIQDLLKGFLVTNRINLAPSNISEIMAIRQGKFSVEDLSTIFYNRSEQIQAMIDDFPKNTSINYKTVENIINRCREDRTTTIHRADIESMGSICLYKNPIEA